MRVPDHVHAWLKDRTTGDYVCSLCGLCDGGVLDDALPRKKDTDCTVCRRGRGRVYSTAYTPYSTYKQRIFHLNELLAQWRRADPEIPAEDLQQIDAAHAARLVAGTPAAASRGDIQQVLLSISADPAHKVERTRWQDWEDSGRAFKPRRFTIYLERWQSLLDRLNPGVLPPPPHEELIDCVRGMFEAMQCDFEELKHRGGGTHSCKRCGCRRNFLNYHLVIYEILRILAVRGRPARIAHEARQHMALFRPPNRTRKSMRAVRLFYRIALRRFVFECRAAACPELSLPLAA